MRGILFRSTAVVVVMMGLTAGAWAQAPTVDGTLDGSYGAAVAVQGVQTDFGDNASELNAAYATVDNGVLYLMFTGNLENNFNKLQLFIDAHAGGQNAIDGANNPQNYDSMIGAGFANGWDPYVNRGLADSPLQAQQGQFTFDAGFEADYAVLFRRGAGKFDFDFAVMDQTVTAADEISDVFIGFEEGASGDLSPFPGNNSGTPFEVGFDNSNVAGIAGGTQAADPVAAQAVTTGIEVAIPLSAIGDPTGDVHITALINGSNHDFVSNQFLAPLELVAPPALLGDANKDDQVTGADLISVQQNFGMVGPIPLLGDANNDGQVTGADLISVQQNFGSVLGVPSQGNLGSDGNGNFLEADEDLDGTVDGQALGVGLIDLNNFAGNQFFTVSIPSAPVPVPEPATLALLVMGVYAVSGRLNRV